MTTITSPDVAILEARGLTRVFGSGAAATTALDDVDLAVGQGEFVSIMGKSGSGKSTLLHLLGGLDRPTAGEIRLDGQRVDTLSQRQWTLRRRGDIGYVFQFFNLVENLTAAENVELPALLAGLSAEEARRRRVELFARLEVSSRAEVVPGALSGGEQQRVAIARALVNRPRVLLADEPTGNLDSSAAAEVMELLAAYHADGQAIVLVTHDPRVAATADRVVRMRDGAIVTETRMGGRPHTARLTDLIALEVG